jgi:hypothetical protein
MAEPSDGPPELPFDYRAFRRSYRWLLLYGPWALAVLGVTLIGIGLFANRPGEVALAAIGFGAAMFIAGVLLPRMRGPVELGPSGVKGAIEALPSSLMYVAGARKAADHAIATDEPDRDRKVNEIVGLTMTELLTAISESERKDFLTAISQASERASGLIAAERETMRRLGDEVERNLQKATKEANRPTGEDS